jgi:ribosome-associated translation inhibitor RaiA
MQILVNSDSAIKENEGNGQLNSIVEARVQDALARFGTQVVTVQVHLSDSNSHKKGDDDKRCMMEARLAGLSPIVVSHDAATIEEAIDAAAEKLQKTIDRTTERLGDHKGNVPSGGEPRM